MSKIDDIVNELLTRLGTVANTDVETGFLSNIQTELESGEQKLVLQIESDGPYTYKHKGGSSNLQIYIGGFVHFNRTDPMTRLQKLLESTRLALAPEADRHMALSGLLTKSIVETEATPLKGPYGEQPNAYFVLPLSLSYSLPVN
jgi:hypothetical protein